MQAQQPEVDVLIPTCRRPCALAVTLSALAAQTFDAVRVVISDQSDESPSFESPEEAIRVYRAAWVSGCGLISSGAYYTELPTTITRRDVDAPKVLPHGG